MTTGSQPLIVCLCGSTKRFMKTAFPEVNSEETLKGNIVVSVGVNMDDDPRVKKMQEEAKTDAERAAITDRIKTQLDWLHRRKIDMADVVIVLQPKGEPLGPSTSAEKEYAERKGKRVEVREVREIDPPQP
jgi:hypothetical protein